MATYTPASLYWGQPFESSVVNGNFTKLSEVLNATVSDCSNVQGMNIKNDRVSLDLSSFRRNTLVESFRSADLRSGGASGEESFLVITNGATPASRPFGVWRNNYDVAGSGIRFYLRETADVQFCSQVSLSRIKSGSVFRTGVGYGAISQGQLDVTAKLLIDGAVAKTIERDIYISTPGTHLYSDFADHRGLSICFNHIQPAMAAGAHTAHINLLFTFSATAASAAYSGIQLKGRGGSTCATAFYK